MASRKKPSHTPVGDVEPLADTFAASGEVKVDEQSPPAAEAATADSPGTPETIESERSPMSKNSHPHVGRSCRYTNAGGYVRAAVVEGVDADGSYRLAVFDPIERCIRHEHGVKVEAISSVG